MGVEAELREVKEQIMLMSEKLDRIIYERDMTALMTLSDRSLKAFLNEEPEVYSVADLKVVY
ncbi:MAG: hypothetical protein U9N40_10240 [Euryarchaeota archaeon]|nr:hypothetical protein [Euryarchaeota archaeon]